ncbi:hypothetical protein GCM10011391_00220 [Pullulanibacillus camelliae]|uniref:Uncharacterized protein n=1 Tax=Pullulanibacillus camelliae TaxID=1707096 RepID=A0A8J2VEH9_9BACL|nr:hypothetical protein [Pullulanibacillus camelliae]GGE25793.1 hypothetical protein GCM10011391_00220 [Pullulanibacillus camelliae]
MATKIDKSFPSEEGESIGVAGMLGAIEATTNRPDSVVGEPSHIMAGAALKQLRLPPKRWG